MKRYFHLSAISKIAAIIALPDESQGLFENANCNLHFCGIGKVNAAFTAAEIILKHGYTHLINLGTAGSQKFPTHTLVECSALVQRDMDLSPLGFPLGVTPFDSLSSSLDIDTFFTQLPRGICGTGDHFATGAPALPCDLVDMEAYAIAKVCKKLGVGFTAIKYISDGSDHNAHNDWAGNLPRAAEGLFAVFESITSNT